MDEVTESTNNMGAVFATVRIGGTGSQVIDIFAAFLTTTFHKFPAIHYRVFFKLNLDNK